MVFLILVFGSGGVKGGFSLVLHASLDFVTIYLNHYE